MPDRKCPKCGGETQSGFLMDRDYGTQAPSEWVEGAVESSFWTGVKTRGRERKRIETSRCTRCGYLELYAP